MSSTTGALAALEVAVAGRGSALLGGELVGVHRETHRTPGFAPVGASSSEDLVETFFDRLVFDLVATRNDHHARHGDLMAFHHRGGGTEVFDPAVGARTDEHSVDADVAHALAGLRPM